MLLYRPGVAPRVEAAPALAPGLAAAKAIREMSGVSEQGVTP
jgi:hypothetical protein